MVSIAQRASAHARTNTTAPSRPARQSSGTKSTDSSQSRANPAVTAIAQASGGRTRTWAVCTVSLIFGNSLSRRGVELPSASTTGETSRNPSCPRLFPLSAQSVPTPDRPRRRGRERAFRQQGATRTRSRSARSTTFERRKPTPGKLPPRRRFARRHRRRAASSQSSWNGRPSGGARSAASYRQCGLAGLRSHWFGRPSPSRSWS